MLNQGKGIDPLSWKVRDNSILLDTRTLDFKIHNRTRGKLRLFLGKFDHGEFFATVPNLKAVDETVGIKVRRIAKFIVKEVLVFERPILS